MYEEAKVLSTATKISLPLTKLTIALISMIFIIGLVGVSIHISFVFLFMTELKLSKLFIEIN